MKRSFFLLHILIIYGWGLTIAEIQDKPSSRAKNFLIWQYLKQDINATEASEAFYQVDNVNQKFLFDYAKKSPEPEIVYTAECMQKGSEELVNITQDDCLYLALTPAKAELLQPMDRDHIASRLEGKFGDVSWLHTMNQQTQFSIFTDTNKSLQLFLVASANYRENHFNHQIEPEVLSELSSIKGFCQLVYSTVTDPKMDQLQLSLSLVSGGNYNHQTHFYLGINALKYGKNDNALFHFKAAYEKAYTKMEKDKTLFWLFRLSHDKTYLDELAESVDINMYSLWAKEQKGVKAENYFTTLPTSGPGGFKGDDPFAWQELHQQIIKSTPDTIVQLVDQNDKDDSVAVQSYILERTYTPLIHSFIMPYDRYMEGLSTDQKAMLYALMRQETRFIPGLISHSFALGLMQIMPFNVDSISKVYPLKVTSYDDMFNPAFNIPYSIEHMKHIDKTLYSPVFKAYAYNGGIGFAKRLITNGSYFLPGEYEPFLSMELVSNAESREYGKRVLANYVIYKEVLGESVLISDLLDRLTQPSQSDCFRAEALKQNL